MKKIQIITNESEKINNYPKDITISDFNNLKSLDEYEINIFDLNCNNMWENKAVDRREIMLETKMTADFKSINQMIVNSTRCINIICLPQNLYYRYQCYSDHQKTQIKDMIPVFMKILEQLIPINIPNIVYENSTTLIGEQEVKSSFYINSMEYDVLTRSNDSNKNTSVKSDKLIITTLDIINDNYELLIDYLKQIKLIEKNVEYPEWLYKYCYNDDEIQNNKIEQAKEQIKLQKEIIEQANEQLQKNLHFKSILYTSSDELVSTVFEIIEDLFDISLTDFNDEKKEDFLFKKDDITYIGEIKGVNSNVKYEYISQLEVHCSKYLDKLQEEGLEEDIRKILIINYERKKDVILRDEVNQEQIALAQKNNSLIIDTKSLLTIYEKVLNGELNKIKVVEYIKNNNGLVDLNLIK